MTWIAFFTGLGIGLFFWELKNIQYKSMKRTWERESEWGDMWYDIACKLQDKIDRLTEKEEKSK